MRGNEEPTLIQTKTRYNHDDVKIRKVFTLKTFWDETTCFELLGNIFREFNNKNDVKWSDDDRFTILIDVKEMSESVIGLTIRGITNPSDPKSTLLEVTQSHGNFTMFL